MNPKVTRFMLKSLYPKVNEEVNSNTSTSFRIVRLDQDPERDESLSEARKVKTSWTR